MDTYILNTVDLSKTYKSNELVVNAVSKVSLQVKPGEFIALVGPSGSGKTTMLAMLATLLESTEGHIYIDGEPFDNMNDKQRAKFRREKIGFTFQDNNLVPCRECRAYAPIKRNLYSSRGKQSERASTPTRIRRTAKFTTITNVKGTTAARCNSSLPYS